MNLTFKTTMEVGMKVRFFFSEAFLTKLRSKRGLRENHFEMLFFGIDSLFLK